MKINKKSLVFLYFISFLSLFLIFILPQGVAEGTFLRVFKISVSFVMSLLFSLLLLLRIFGTFYFGSNSIIVIICSQILWVFVLVMILI